MSEFCRQCSEEYFGKDMGDLADLSKPEDTEQKLYPGVICEGCGPTQVDHTGKCIASDCLEKHATWRKCPWDVCHITTLPRTSSPCKFAITDKAGNPDCGYG